MDYNLGNNESFFGLDWIINEAKRGFFFVLASHKMQERIANAYTASAIAKLNYSDSAQYCDYRLYDQINTEHYKFRVLNMFADDHAEKKIFFILNFQIPFPTTEDIYNLNLSRDLIADKKKVWIFFMTAELEFRLFQSARDFHSYCNLKLQFEDVGIEESKQELLNLSDTIYTIHQINEIRERLARYKVMEDEYMSYFETAPDGSVHLIRQDLSDSQLLATANTLDNIAELYHKTGEYNKTIKLLEIILFIRETILGLQHPDTATSYNDTGFFYDSKGDYDRALGYYAKALTIQYNVLTEEHPHIATTLNNIGLTYYNKGDYDRALEYYAKALTILENDLNKGYPRIDSIYNNMGMAYNKKSAFDQALENFEKALELQDKDLNKEHPDRAATYNNIASVYNNKGDYHMAFHYYEKAFAVLLKVVGEDHPLTAATCNNMALAYDLAGNYGKAIIYLRKAQKISEKILGREHPQTQIILKNIASVHGNQSPVKVSTSASR